MNFTRLLRTSSSEEWCFFIKDERVASVSLHFSNYVFCTVILENRANENESLEELICQIIDEKIVGGTTPREDLIINVYNGKETNMYSDRVDHEELSITDLTKKEFNEKLRPLNRLLSKSQKTKGQLNEFVVKEYFEKLGFESKKANTKLDSQKIDLIAENENLYILCQIKLGNINNKEISKILASYLKNDLGKKSKKNIICIVADTFPINIELIKSEIQNKENFELWTINKNQVLKYLPEFKQTIK